MSSSGPEQVAATAAHDLRGHLLGIAGYAQLLRRAVPTDAAAEEMVEQICLGAENGLDLIDELLAYASCLWRPVLTEPVDLDRLVADLTQDAAVRVGPLGTVRGDPALIRHLLRHVLRNALLHVAPGVTPQVDVSATPTADGRLEVRISDNGIGIEDREAAFEPFQRGSAASSHPGHGLGLTICREVVTRHGGQIAVEDSPYGGTMMIFTLPRDDGS